VNGARGVVVGFKKATQQDSNSKQRFDDLKEYPEVLFTSGLRRIVTPEDWSIDGTSCHLVVFLLTFL